MASRASRSESTLLPVFHVALKSSHLRHSARVLKTSHVPMHNACATLQRYNLRGGTRQVGDEEREAKLSV